MCDKDKFYKRCYGCGIVCGIDVISVPEEMMGAPGYRLTVTEE